LFQFNTFCAIAISKINININRQVSQIFYKIQTIIWFKLQLDSSFLINIKPSWSTKNHTNYIILTKNRKFMKSTTIGIWLTVIFCKTMQNKNKVVIVIVIKIILIKLSRKILRKATKIWNIRLMAFISIRHNFYHFIKRKNIDKKYILWMLKILSCIVIAFYVAYA